jgi:hypothetical protein
MNRIIVGHIWEAVEDEPSKFYEILNDEEIITLRQLGTKDKILRFRGQVTGYGRVRPRRKNDDR